MDFFATPTTNSYEENVFKLTTPGLITVGVLLALLVVVAVVLRPKKENTVIMATKQLVFSAVAMSLAVITAQLKLTKLPFGGSVTLFSMLFIALIGYWYGLKAGLLTGFAYGLLQFLLDPVFYAPFQLLLDYPLAFGALGLSGVFANKKNGLVKGYLLGVVGRFIFHYISGIVFFGHYAPEGTPAALYSLTYNASYLVPEAVVTAVLLSIPSIRNAFHYVALQARSSKWASVNVKA